ncbi:unnamed protein product [Acanthoscelides obtectus]|uniref:Cytochrome P450 n=1 Tax=Acanthoscelides obtectus TaxID=200917 RepID=A0A9P0JY69_ACAOB|nr:unnamed protein product [Acanthoscelides obtectus]CAK1633933.1 Probable cytochrome P450 4aa1 [Acanthoscelides obtectus]
MMVDLVYVILPVLFFSLLTCARFLRDYFRTVCLAFRLKGPPALPILGNVLTVKDFPKMAELGTNASQLYGSLFRCWISLAPFIWVYEPNHLKIILGNSKSSKKNVFYSILHNFVGAGLITNNGHKWRKNRKHIQPYFHINILESYIDIFMENARKFTRDFDGNKKDPVNITSYINKCVLNTLHESILGVPVDEDSPYRKGEVMLTQRIAKPWLLLESIFNLTPFAKKEYHQKVSLHNYTRKVLERRKIEYDKSSLRCLLDMFIEIADNNKDFSDEDMINEGVTFMLAGQDSVGAAIAFTLFFLAKHPDVQRKVYEEIDNLRTGSMISVTQLNNMKYLEQVIKESLRLVPSVPVFSRVLTEDVKLDEHILGRGTNIFVSPFITHRLPHYFPDPLKFDPDRFSQENIERMHPYSFIPFSIGPRNCIGE